MLSSERPPPKDGRWIIAQFDTPPRFGCKVQVVRWLVKGKTSLQRKTKGHWSSGYFRLEGEPVRWEPLDGWQL